MLTDTVPNGALSPRPVRTPAALVLAHAELAVRGHERWVIPQGGLVLGREAVAGDYQLVDARLSRRHAAIEPDGQGGLQVRDLGSRNGTGVNGHRLEGAHRLAHGDVLRLGDTLLVFVAASALTSATHAAAPGSAASGSATHAAAPAAPAALAGAAPAAPGSARVHAGYSSIKALTAHLLGHSAPMTEVRHRIAQLALAPVHVLIAGESGTGKEAIARALHAASPAPRGPFVPISPSGVPDATLESQLNAAWQAHATIYIDGLSELSRPLQAQLHRALAAPQVPVRVIGATTRDLAELARFGSFLPELHALLAAHTIRPPALRERREDIALLVADALARRGAAGRAVEADLAQALLLSAWPLNLRGLANVVEAALAAAPVDAPLALVDEVAHMFAVGDAMTATAAPASPPLPDTGASVARGRAPIADELRLALSQSGGNVAEAARRFGCSRQQMYRWMRAVGVDLAEFRAVPPSR